MELPELKDALRFLGHLAKTGNFLELERLEIFRRLGMPGPHRRRFREWKRVAAGTTPHPRYTLDAMLRHAADTVPAYRGVSPDSLENFPVVGKEELRRDPRSHLSRAIDEGDLRYFTTAGSTGIPFGFHYQKEVDTIRDAFFAVMWEAQGYRPYDRSMVLRGTTLPKGQAGARVTRRYDPLNNELAVSTYDLSWDTLEDVVALARKFRPKVLKCYPSMGALLSKFIRQRGLEIRIPLVFCGSENIYAWQIDLMEKALGGKVFSWYGHSENAVLAALTPARDGYSVFTNYGVVELVDASGGVIREAGVSGQIAATSLVNRGMPFIRYLTADRACWLRPPGAGGAPVLSMLEGRLQELFIGKSGNVMSMTAINMHSDIFDALKQFQFVQNEAGRLVMRIVPAASRQGVDLRRIREELSRKTKDSIDYEFEFVDEIPLPPNGKHKFLIQNLRLDAFADRQPGPGVASGDVR